MSFLIKPGKLNKRIEIQSPTSSNNSFGEAVRTWTTQFTRWGSINPIGGRERIVAAKALASVTHEIVMRDVTGIEPNWRLKYNNRIFNIEYVIDDEERGSKKIIMCKEERV